MATHTTNYNLTKPEASDPFADFRADYNDNLDIIDANLGGGGGSSSLAGLSDVNLTTPTDGQVLTYDGNSSEWVNANAGGGGGDVMDVEVNGVSVVDGNKVAKITSYKEVTQTQYDALPATKLTDGIAYFIKDAPNNIFSFSTNEEIVGTWITGKPVYQKTYNIGSKTIPAQGSSLYVNIDTDTTKEFINGFGTYKWTNNGVTYSYFIGSTIFNDANTTDVFKSQFIKTSNVGLRAKFTQKVSSSPVSITDFVVTIQYTKTTD